MKEKSQGKVKEELLWEPRTIAIAMYSSLLRTKRIDKKAPDDAAIHN
jgi:hypothetical protein